MKKDVNDSAPPAKLYNVPMPQQVDIHSAGAIRLYEGWSLEAEEASERIAAEYKRSLRLQDFADKHICLIPETTDSEAYQIDLQRNRITVRAGGEQGFRYALYTMQQASRGYTLPLGKIQDKPLLKMRGYHLNLATLFRMSIDELLLMVKWAAESKINTLLIEYDKRFPFTTVPGACSPDVLTKDDVSRLISAATGYGIEVIPLMQTFGHLEYLLSDKTCESLREVPDNPAQLCPRKRESEIFMKKVIDEYIALHPGLKYIHLGGDETRQLGKCPECAEFAEKYGIGRLYTEWMNKMIDYVCSKGVTPLIYDDMICTHPEALDALDRRAVIVYWDYWATAPEIPHIIARYGTAPVYTYDSRWTDGTWTQEADDVELRVLQFFASHGGSKDVRSVLGPAFMERYGKYLGPHFPKFFKAFPYLEYYQDQGFQVIGMPTSMGNTDNYLGMPNQARFTANIRVCCERMAQAGAMGVITSAWYPFPAAMYPLGICTAGFYSWGMPEYMPSVPDWR